MRGRSSYLARQKNDPKALKSRSPVEKGSSRNRAEEQVWLAQALSPRIHIRPGWKPTMHVDPPTEIALKKIQRGTCAVPTIPQMTTTSECRPRWLRAVI
jgi:hypothetical protein